MYSMMEADDFADLRDEAAQDEQENDADQDAALVQKPMFPKDIDPYRLYGLSRKDFF